MKKILVIFVVALMVGTFMPSALMEVATARTDATLLSPPEGNVRLRRARSNRKFTGDMLLNAGNVNGDNGSVGTVLRTLTRNQRSPAQSVTGGGEPGHAATIGEDEAKCAAS